MADFNPRRNLEDYLAENPFEETSNEDNAGDAPGQPTGEEEPAEVTNDSAPNDEATHEPEGETGGGDEEPYDTEDEDTEGEPEDGEEVTDYSQDEEEKDWRKFAKNLVLPSLIVLGLFGGFLFFNSIGREDTAAEDTAGTVAAPPSKDLTSNEIVEKGKSSKESSTRARPRLGNETTTTTAKRKSSSGRATPRMAKTTERDTPQEPREPREKQTRVQHAPQPEPAPQPQPQPQPEPAPQPQLTPENQPQPQEQPGEVEAQKPTQWATTTIAPDVTTVNQAPDRK